MLRASSGTKSSRNPVNIPRMPSICLSLRPADRNASRRSYSGICWACSGRPVARVGHRPRRLAHLPPRPRRRRRTHRPVLPGPRPAGRYCGAVSRRRPSRTAPEGRHRLSRRSAADERPADRPGGHPGTARRGPVPIHHGGRLLRMAGRVHSHHRHRVPHRRTHRFHRVLPRAGSARRSRHVQLGTTRSG